MRVILRFTMVPFEPISDDKEDVGFVPENMLNSDCFILWDKNSETEGHFEIFFKIIKYWRI